MAHSPLIFKYPKHYPTKQHFITHSPTQNQKIQNPLFCFFFTLFLFTVYMPPPTPLVPAAPKQNKTLSLAQLSHPLKLRPHDPKKKKKRTNHYFLSSYFLKINHLEQGCRQRVSFQFPLHLFLVFFFFFFPLNYLHLNIHTLFNFSQIFREIYG